jgi:hypothetical protein
MVYSITLGIQEFPTEASQQYTCQAPTEGLLCQDTLGFPNSSAGEGVDFVVVSTGSLRLPGN